MREFIESCFSEFRVAVWTSASEDYAAEVVAQLFGGAHRLAFLWTRSRCTLQFDHLGWVYPYAKNLKKVKRLGHALEQVIAVDSTAEKWKRQHVDLVQVSDFEGDGSDRELIDLQTYLTYLEGVDDVRAVEKCGWRANGAWRCA